jgi:hypothetical protein
MKNVILLPAVLAGICCAVQGYTVELSQMPVVGGQVSGTSAVASGTVPAGVVQNSKSAVVRLLDKQSNRVDHLTIEAGKTQKWGALNVTLSKCAWNVGGVGVQDVAWLDVTAGSGEPEFHGWMFNTFPSVATYDHPRYDVELEKCTRPAGYTTAAPARVAPPTPSGQEHESDDEAPKGMGVDTQFVVPGIPNDSAPVAPAQPGAPAAAVEKPAADPAAQQLPERVDPAQLPTPAAIAPAAQPELQQQPPQGDQQQLLRMMDGPSGQ